jgi:hypothetical protein
MPVLKTDPWRPNSQPSEKWRDKATFVGLVVKTRHKALPVVLIKPVIYGVIE